MVNNTLIDYSEDNTINIETNKSIVGNIDRWEKRKKNAISQFSDINKAKDKLISIKERNLYNLNTVISKFEKNFTANGGNLFIVPNTKDVIDILLRIIKEEEVKNVLLSKSTILEELNVRESISKKISEITYTNIAEHIEKINNNKSSHMVLSAIGYDIDEVLELVKKKYPIEDNVLTHEGISRFVSDKIKEKISEADTVISGANALIAETGSIIVVENEGNNLKSFAFAKTHIVIAGIDKLYGSIKDLDIIFPMLSSFGVGQKMATYGTIITPTDDKNNNVYLIIVNNDRTELLKNNKLKSMLRCVKCGACSNVCPVYKKVGGYAYENAYPGPYGTIVSPYIESMKNNKHLPYASTLCGKCTEICPVNINIHDNIINIRSEIVKKEIHSLTDDKFIKTLYNKTLRRRKMNGWNYSYKMFKYRRLLKKPWGLQRELPEFARNSFSKQFTDKQKNEL